MVLATDLSKHFDFISQLKVTPEAALSPDGHTSQSSLDVNLLLTVAIKFVDIGHSYKPWAQHEQWSHWVTGRLLQRGRLSTTTTTTRVTSHATPTQVTEEFFALGDKERSEEWAVSPLCDREKDSNLPKNQCGFFEYAARPLSNGRRAAAWPLMPLPASPQVPLLSLLQGRRPNSTEGRARPPTVGVEFRDVEEVEGGDRARLLQRWAR